MNKLTAIIVLLLCNAAFNLGYAKTVITDEFSVEINSEGAQLCKITFNPSENTLTADNNDTHCKVDGDINTGFSVVLQPSTETADKDSTKH